MNKTYKLKFNRQLQQIVVVSEIANVEGKSKTQGVVCQIESGWSLRHLFFGVLKPLSYLSLLMPGMLPGMLLAANLPTGGTVVFGKADITVAGNSMTVNQHSPNLAADWKTFDIGASHSVQFVQPDSSSVALNRVTGASPSQIMGILQANGKVFLINPNGVLFGKGASVNTAGFLATTKNISNKDFINGNYTFSGASAKNAQIINQGSLTTSQGGFIVLAADQVSNQGTIRTPGGKTVLAAAQNVTLQLDNDGLTSVRVNGSVVNALVENRGLISATDGQVYLTARGKNMLLRRVINNQGVVEARGLSSKGGVIYLNGGDSGVVSHSGSLLADSNRSKGGRVTVEGENIHLAAGSRISASGKTGGGEAYIGGGWQGKDAKIHNAEKLVMDKTAVVNVSADEQGDGGTAVLWSEQYTDFKGNILARGGKAGGHGGQIETSSKNNLQALGNADASAENGKGGLWLLDPTDVTIVTGTSDAGVSNSTVAGTDVFSPQTDRATISVSSINDRLKTGTSVKITTSGTDTDGHMGNITINRGAVIAKNAGGDATLTLQANRDITFADTDSYGSYFINTTAGKLNLNLFAGNRGVIKFGKFFWARLNGGDLTISPEPGTTGRSIAFTAFNNGHVSAGNITITANSGFTGTYLSMEATNNLTINAGSSNINFAGEWGALASYSAGNILTLNTTGNIFANARNIDSSGGRVALSGVNGVNIYNVNSLILTSTTHSNTSVNITSSNGTVNVSAKNVRLENARITANSTIAGRGDIIFTNAEYIELINSHLTGKNITALNINNPNEKKAWLQRNSTLMATAGNIHLTNNPQRVVSERIFKAEGGSFDENSVVNATGNIELNFLNLFGDNGYVTAPSYHGVFIGKGSTFTAGQDVRITGETRGPQYGNGIAIIAYSDRDRRITISALRGNVTLTAIGTKKGRDGAPFYRCVDCQVNGSHIERADISAGQNLIISGKAQGLRSYSWQATRYGQGLIVNNVTFNAASASLDGSSESYRRDAARGDYGLGFNLSNIKWLGGLADATKIVLNANQDDTNKARSSLGAGAFTADQYKVILPNGIRNSDTYIHFGDLHPVASRDSGDWSYDYSVKDDAIRAGRNRNWLMERVTFKQNGNINVSGLNFTDSDISATGNITLANSNGWGTLKIQSDKNAVFNNMSISNLMLTSKGNLTTTGTTLTNPQINVTHDSNMNSSNITNGNITVGGQTSLTDSRITNSKIDAMTDLTAMNVIFTGSTLNVTQDSRLDNGTLTNSNLNTGGDINSNNLTIATSNITVNGTANLKDASINNSGITAKGNISLTGDKRVHIYGGSSLKTEQSLLIDIDNSSVPVNSDTLNISGATLTAAEDINISVNSLKDGTANAGYAFYSNSSNYTAKNMKVNVSANGTIHDSAVKLYNSNFTSNLTVNVSVNSTSGGGRGVSLGDTSDSGSSGRLPNLNVTGNAVINANTNIGSAIELNGNVDVGGNLILTGSSTSSGSGVIVGKPDKTLTVKGDTFSVNGSSATGSGVVVAGGSLSAPASGTISGTSSTGTGVKVNSSARLDGFTVSGNSSSGSGVHTEGTLLNATIIGNTLTGKGVAVTGTVNNSTITGNATSGTGVDFTSPTTLGNTRVTGNTETGVAVLVENILSGDNDSSVTGIASGKDGVGVKLDGNQVNGGLADVSDPENIRKMTIRGSASTGHAIELTTDITLINVTLIGDTSDSGTGVSFAGSATLDGATVTGGSSGSGTGVSATGGASSTNGSSITGNTGTGSGSAVVLGGAISGGTISGTASSGAGVTLAADSRVSSASLAGTSDSGSAVTFAGNATLDHATITGISAVSGTGVTTSNPGTVTSTGTTTITGNTSGGTGDAVSLSGNISGGTIHGTSSGGSGISLADGSSVSGAELTGTTTSGAGITFAGSADLTDSSVTGSSTGTGADSGSGVVATSATGTLISTGSSITGTSAGSEAAVSLAGTVIGGVISGTASSSGAGISLAAGTALEDSRLTGESGSGIGVGFDEDGTLSNTSISGTSSTGTGVLTHNLHGDSKSTITGIATGDKGTGVDLKGSTIHGGDTDTSTPDDIKKMLISGCATTGSAVTLADPVTVTNVTISGLTSDSGTGVSFAGSATLDGATVTGGSTGSGTGVSATGGVSSTNGSRITGDTSTGSGTAVELAGVIAGGTIGGTSGSGSGISLADGSSVSGAELTGTTTSGAGITFAGSADLADSSVTGSSTGTDSGSGVVATSATGTLISTGSSITGTSAGSEAAVSLAGTVIGGVISGTASSSGAGISLAADTVLEDSRLTGESGSGVGVGFDKDGTLSNTSISGTSSTGTGVLTHDLHGDSKSTITGIATGDKGTGVDLKGSTIHGGNADTSTPEDIKNMLISGCATTGSAVTLAGPVTVTNVTISGLTSDSGTGVSLAGSTTLDGVTVTGGSSGSGTGVSATGGVSSTNDSRITGDTSTGSGAAVELAGVIAGGIISGTSGGGSGISLADGSSVSGAELTGTATSGAGISLAAGTALEDSRLTGESDSGVGVGFDKDGTLSNTSISGTSSTGTGVLTHDLHGDSKSTITGIATGDKGTGVNLKGNTIHGGDADTSTDDIKKMLISGCATTGSAVTLADPVTVTNVMISGLTSDSGTGVSFAGSTTLDGVTVTGGSSGSGTGVSATGGVSSTNGSSITGNTSTGSGTAVELDGTIMGGVIAGTSFSGEGIRLGEEITLYDTSLTGKSDTGDAVLFSGSGNVINSTLNGSARIGGGIRVPRNLSSDLDSTFIGYTEAGEVAIFLGGYVAGGNFHGSSLNNTDLPVFTNTKINDSIFNGNSIHVNMTNNNPGVIIPSIPEADTPATEIPADGTIKPDYRLIIEEWEMDKNYRDKDSKIGIKVCTYESCSSFDVESVSVLRRNLN